MDETIEELYSKYTSSIEEALADDRYFQYLFEMIQASENTLHQTNRVLHKVVDESWLTVVEDGIEAIFNIVDKPRRFITTSEEIVPVELAKKITADSVRHLSQNTQFIATNAAGEMHPTKILNVTTEESYDLYENRFVYHLIQRLFSFVDKRTDVIFWATGDETCNIMSMESKVDDAYEEITYKVEMMVKNKQSLVENDSDNMSVFKRIDRVRRMSRVLRSSSFCEIMNGCAKVYSPIQRTNLMMKDPDYRRCYKLWQFIESYDEVGYSIEAQDSAMEFDEEYLLQMYINMINNYTVFKSLLESDPRKMWEIEVEKKEPVKPKFIKEIKEEIVDCPDLPDVEIRKVFVEEVTQAQLDAEAALEEEKQRSADLEQTISQMEYSLSDMQWQMDSLNEQMLQLSEMNQQAEEDKAALMAQIEELKADAEARVAAAKAEAEAKIAEANAEAEDRVVAAKAEAEDRVAQITAEAENKVAEAYADAEAKVEAANVDAETRVAAAKAEADAKVDAAKADAEDRVAAANADAEARVEAARVDADNKVAQITAEAETRVAEANADAEARVEAARVDADNKVAQITAEAENRIATINANCEDVKNKALADKEAAEKNAEEVKQQAADEVLTANRYAEETKLKAETEVAAANKHAEDARKQAEEAKQQAAAEIAAANKQAETANKQAEEAKQQAAAEVAAANKFAEDTRIQATAEIAAAESIKDKALADKEAAEKLAEEIKLKATADVETANKMTEDAERRCQKAIAKAEANTLSHYIVNALKERKERKEAEQNDKDNS